MVALGGQYDGQELTYEPMPAGEYAMHITSSEMVKTKDGSGDMLKLELEVIDGAQAGRRLTERLNLVNRNSQAVEIAQRTLRSIVFAAGLQTCTDSEQLHMRRMLVSVAVEERRDQPGTMANRIKGYKAGGATGSVPANKPKPAATGSGGGSAPWKRNAA